MSICLIKLLVWKQTNGETRIVCKDYGRESYGEAKDEKL